MCAEASGLQACVPRGPCGHKLFQKYCRPPILQASFRPFFSKIQTEKSSHWKIYASSFVPNWQSYKPGMKIVFSRIKHDYLNWIAISYNATIGFGNTAFWHALEFLPLFCNMKKNEKKINPPETWTYLKSECLGNWALELGSWQNKFSLITTPSTALKMVHFQGGWGSKPPIKIYF